ncbi:MAG: toprim domain-containing protein, partial [Steroidobacteraceae bacterium]
ALWGDPDRAPRILLSEGIETGAALAFAFREEIAAGRAVVAAAVSATGVEAFIPWPATRRVTVCADRDEAPKNGKPGSQRGERAAREFGIRQHGTRTVVVAIALPGAEGEAIDWLDVLSRDGADTVRAGVLAADPFVPTAGELEERTRRARCADELQHIIDTYPLPALDTMTLLYRLTPTGRVKVHKVGGMEMDSITGEKLPILIPVATPFGVPARLRFAEQADAYGLRCVVQDMSGKPRDVDFDRANLAKMGASDIRAALFAAGLRTEGEGEQIAVACLKAADPEQEIIVLRRPGWHQVAPYPDPFFVSPNGPPSARQGDCAWSWRQPHAWPPM